MKENYQYNSKNVEIKDKIILPEVQMSKQDLELIASSAKRVFTNLNQLLSKTEFKSTILIFALYNLIKYYKHEESFYKCLKLLLHTNLDLNYKFSFENNKTIFMIILEKNISSLFQIFLENINIKINSIKILPPDKKDEYQISEFKKFFSQKDNNNNNFSHLFQPYDKKELYQIFLFLYEKFPFLNNQKPEISQNIQKIFNNLFNEKNDDGDTIMSLSLERNLINLVFKLLSINKYKYRPNINSKNNNLLHSAIMGGNLSCVKIILYYCSEEELIMKNNDLLTPAQLAFKIGLNKIGFLINEYMNNFCEEYREHFYKNNEIYRNKIYNLSDDLMHQLELKKYKETFYELKELKILYSISNDIINTNNNNNSNKNNNNCNSNITEENIFYQIGILKLEWNIILMQIYISKLNNNKIQNNKEKNNDIKSKNNINDLYKIIHEFYIDKLTTKLILSYLELLNRINQTKKIQNNNNFNRAQEIDNISPKLINIKKPIDILLYNKMIFLFKIGEYESLMSIAELYFQKVFNFDFNIDEYNESNINKILNIRLFNTFINISFILVEILFAKGYKSFAELIMKGIKGYLKYIETPRQMKSYSDKEKNICLYLSKKGLFQEFSAYFSEIECYMELIKLINNKENIDNKKKFDEYLSKIIFAIDPSIFAQMGMLMSYVEIKKMYENDDNKIGNKFEEFKYNEQSQIFYFNTLGIIFLKKQKYFISKIFFTKGYNIYMQAIKHREKKNESNYLEDNLYIFRIDIITSFLYNISLCCFYLKEYQKCINILEQILNYKSNKNNFFIYYRLGLCYYYSYIDSCNKNIDCFNKNIHKLIGYEKIKNYKKNENIKQLSIELDNDEIISNLSQKFDAEFKKKNNKFSFHNDKNEKIDKIHINKNNNNNTYLNVKKIILKNTTKLINIKNNMNKKNFNIGNNSNIFNNPNMNKFEIKIDLLSNAIKCFKRVIYISKLNSLNTNTSSMKFLYQFYLTYLEEKEKQNYSNDKNSQIFSKDKKIPNDLLINTYFNLLMCLSIKKNWLEMILYIKDYNNREIDSNKIIELKILLYELEAYINLRNSKKTKEIITKIKKFKKISLPLLNKGSNEVINDVNIKLYVYYTLTNIYIKEKNFKEIDTNVNKIVFLLKQEKNIPYYIIDLLLNVYIIKLNSEPNINEKTKYRYNNIILNLIKNKKTNDE